MADKRAYFKLDVGYLTNPKVSAVLDASATAVILHMGSIAYAAQHLTDGVVPMALVRRLTGAERTDEALLLDHGLWRDLGDGSAQIHDFLEHQRSASEVKRASDKAKDAAAARWMPPTDAQRNASSIASSIESGMPDAMRSASESSMPREREREKERTTTSPASQAVSEFASWYAHYPRKTGKAAAEKAFIKALKTTELETLMAGVIRYARDPNLPEKQYIPHPSKWLNDGRWDDDPLPPKTGGAPPPPKPAGRDDWMYR